MDTLHKLLPHFTPKKAAIAVGLLGLTAFHLSTNQYGLAANDVLTLLAASHFGPVLDLLNGAGIKVPADPTADPAVAAPKS